MGCFDAAKTVIKDPSNPPNPVKPFDSIRSTGSTASTTPAAPDAVDPNKASLDFINAMADPVLQQKLLDSERQFRPEYTNLNLQDMGRFLLGGEGQAGALSYLGDASHAAGKAQVAANTQQRYGDISDVEQLGGRASAAFRNANPALMQQMGYANRLQGGANPYQGFADAVGQGQPNFGNINFQGAQANQINSGQVNGGLLGMSLYGQALQAGGLGELGTSLQGQGMKLAQSTGAMTPDEQRVMEQQLRQSYGARGTLDSSGSVSAEALGRLTNERQNRMNDLGMAGQINAQNQAELGANRGFQQNVQGAELGRQFQNVGNDLQAQGQNQDAANQFALYNNQQDLATQDANRQFASQQYQQQLGNLGMLGQFNASQLGQDRAYAGQLFGMESGMASDPFQAILGRQSGAVGYGSGQTGMAGAYGAPSQGPQLFDPNAGINLALQNNANLSNYNASIYGANSAQAGAKAGGQGAMIGGGLAAGGMVVAAMI